MTQTDQIEKLLSSFDPVNLDALNGAEFMKRTDTKFIFSFDQLQQLLPKLLPYYKILEVSGIRLAYYENLYFDTPDLKFFYDHHRQKSNRHKVRLRNYQTNNLTFLEVKFKNNKGITIKSRKETDRIKNHLEQNEFSFIKKHINNGVELIPVFRSRFNRITLLNKQYKERLTIDFSLMFFNGERTQTINHLVIAEAKQERVNRRSEFFTVSKEMGILPFRVSKYCIGMSFLNQNLRSNRFKSKLLKIQKINSHDTP